MNKERVMVFLRQYWPYIMILALSAFLRFFRLAYPFSYPGVDYPFSVNGADEGIHLMAARLGAHGYQMYVQVNAQQGPLFMYVYGLFEGDPMAARIMSVLFSMVGLIGMIFMAEKVANRTVGILTTLFLSFNFLYFKESRIASVDLYCTVFLIWAFYFMVKYYLNVEKARYSQEKLSYMNSLFLVLAGTLFSMAAMSKLFAVIPLMCLGCYMFVRWLRSLRLFKHLSKHLFIDMVIMVVATLIPTLIIMSIFGLEETFQGMFLDNLNRPTQDSLIRLAQFSAFGGILLIPIIFSMVAMFRYFRDRTVQLIMVWVLSLFFWLLFQSLTWMHHLTLLAPPICLLGSIGVYHLLVQPVGSRVAKQKTVSLKEFFRALAYERGVTTITDDDSMDDHEADVKKLEKVKVEDIREGKLDDVRKAASRTDISKAIWHDITYSKRKLFIIGIVMFFILLTAGSNIAFVLYTDEPIEYTVAMEVKDLTDDGDMVISGDPLVSLYANRDQPPEATNLAIVRYPPIDPVDLINYTWDYDVRVVILTYNLTGWTDYVDFVREYYDFHKGYDRHGLVSEIEGEVPIALLTFNIYVLPDDVSLKDAREEYITFLRERDQSSS